MKRIFLIIFVLMTIAVSAQQTLPCTQIGVNNLGGQNPYITGSCLEVSSDLHVNNKNVIMEADNRIHFGPGTNISPVQQGDLHASIRPNALQVAWMEPATMGSVGQFKKLELGVKVPDEIQTQIFQFLNSGASAVDVNHPGLNPFNPEEVSVEAVFNTSVSHPFIPVPIAIERKAIGFWYREFDRQQLGNEYTELATDYHFRVRFAPPRTGNWTCVIRMYINGALSYETSPFHFNVVSSGNPGYVKVGDSKRFLVRGNNMFFPIGVNIPQISCHGQLPELCNSSYYEPSNNQELTDSNKYYEEAYRFYQIPTIEYDFFRNDILAVANSGANTFRYLLSPWGNDFEFERLNNYDNFFYHDPNTDEIKQSLYRSQFSWELDRFFETAENNNVFMLLNVIWQEIFSIQQGNLYDWDANNTEGYPDDMGYCYHTELDLQSETDFLSNSEAKKYFKYRLRYIAARWGYSTALLSLQLNSEINGAFNVNGNDAYDPTHSQIESWHIEMLSYLKDSLKIQQLTSVSYAGEPGRPYAETPYTTAYDRSFYLQNLDLPTYNMYQNLPSRQAQVFGIRKSWFPANNDEFYSNYQAGWSYDYYKSNQMKPFINGEIGSMGPDRWSLVCDNKAEWIRNTFITPFTGMAGMSLHWHAGFNYALWQSHFPKIAAFLSSYNFNESSGNVKGWMPGFDYVLKNKLYWVGWPHFYESHPEFYGVVDAFYLRSPDNENAVGIVANRTYNFYTSWTCSNDPFGGDLAAKKIFRCLDDNEEDGNNVEDDKPWVLVNDDLYSYKKTVSHNDEKLYIEGLSGNSGLLGKRYTVEFISPWTLSVVATVTDRKGANGVQIKYPDIRGVKETSMYLIRVYPHKDKSAALNPMDTTAIKEMYDEMNKNFQNNQELTLEFEIRVYPNPANDCLNIEIPALSGLADISIYDLTGRMIRKTDSYEVLTKIDISSFNPGTFIIKITTGNSIKTIKFVKQ